MRSYPKCSRVSGIRSHILRGTLVKIFILFLIAKIKYGIGKTELIHDVYIKSAVHHDRQTFLLLNPSLQVMAKHKSRRTKPHTESINRFRHKHMLVLIILLCGDVESNPGPANEDSLQFPCKICLKEVTWNADALQCDGCESWLHRDCMCMSHREYSKLGHLNVAWTCPRCDLLNISKSLFSPSKTNIENEINSKNHFGSLVTETDSFNYELPSMSSNGSPGTPLHTSSPNKTHHPTQKRGKTSLKILNVNCQSVRYKKLELHNLITRTNPDIIIGTESWLDANDVTANILPSEEYDYERRDRKTTTHGGGVFIGFKRDLIFERVSELETDCEVLWCKLNTKGSKTLQIGAYYRPHEDDEDSLNELETSLQRIGSRNENVILGGDLNFPSWDWKNKRIKPNCNCPALYYKLSDMFDDHGMAQMVEEPTRGNNTLDLFTTTSPSKVINVQVVPGISDHECPLMEVDTSPIRRTQKPRNIKLYKKAKWDSFSLDLIGTVKLLQQMEATHSVEEMWSTFKTAITDGIQRHIPTKLCKKKNSLPYLTKPIKTLMNRRDSIYSKMKAQQRELNCSTSYYDTLVDKFKTLKRTIQKSTRNEYWRYIEELIKPDEENQYCGMKRFWSYVKQSRKDYTGVSTLKHQGQSYSTPIEKANVLNNQFKSVFTHEKRITRSLLPQHRQHPTIGDINITEPGVHKLLSKLKIHKACGPDDIGPRILKELADVTAPMLTSIFRKSYQTGELPADWKSANVTPIFKKGSKSDAANYRPISLTCTACKIMEHIVTSHVMSHSRDNNVLYDLQHGFRDQRSCETQLLEFTSDITSNMTEGKQTDILVMDFSKAFDKVGHEKLLKKLDHYGITGKTNNWIRGFLSNRKQTVVVEGEKSDEAPVMSGVPQGSVLGPCLFLHYINDMPDHTKHSRIRLFADDTIMYLAITNNHDAKHLQEDLNRLADWEQKWQMEFHPGKCQVLTVSRKRTIQRSQYKLHGHILEQVDHAKYLGVTFASDMRWGRHTDNITAKASQTLAFLRRNLQINSPRLKTIAYQSLVRPQLEYAATTWDPHTATDTKKIEMVQRRAARYVLNRYHNTSHVSNMLDELDWPTLQDRRRNLRLTMLYKIRNNLVATTGADQLTPLAHSSRHHNSCAYEIHSGPQYYTHSFYQRTIREWNKLEEDTVSANTLEKFKIKLAESYKH